MYNQFNVKAIGNVIREERRLASGKLDFEEQDLLENELKDWRQIIKRRKRNKMKRQQSIAKQYIANVEKGLFPKKEAR